MPEQCPLTGIRFDTDIPEYCREHCADIWDDVSATQVGSHDEFSSAEDSHCPHSYTENGGESLQRADGASRIYSLQENCMSCGSEVGADSFTFICTQTE